MAEENIQNPTPNGDNNVQPTDNQPPKGGEPQVNNTPSAPSASPDDVQKAVLEQLGVKSLDEAKNALEGFKQWQESQKTEQEKQTEQMGTLQEQLKTTQAEKANLSAKVEALSKGVNPDALEDVIKLVAGEENVGEAIDKLLTKYPHFAQVQANQQQQTAPKPTFGQPQYNEPAQSTEADTWKAVMQKFMKR